MLAGLFIYSHHRARGELGAKEACINTLSLVEVNHSTANDNSTTLGLNDKNTTTVTVLRFQARIRRLDEKFF